MSEIKELELVVEKMSYNSKRLFKILDKQLELITGRAKKELKELRDNFIRLHSDAVDSLRELKRLNHMADFQERKGSEAILVEEAELVRAARVISHEHK